MSSSATSSVSPPSSGDDSEKKVESFTAAEKGSRGLRYVNPDNSLKLTEEEQAVMKSYLRKADIRIIIYLAIGYVIFFVNRSTMFFAKMTGMQKDLHLKGAEYNTALSCFYVAYFIFQLPMNILLRRIGMRIYIPLLLILTGLFNLVTLPVTNFGGLAAMRFFEGMSQAGYLSGCYYIITTWYPRSYVPTRISYIILATVVSSIISTALMVGFSKITHAAWPLWKYYYLLSGLLAVVHGFCGYFVLRNYPETSHFIADDEKKLIKDILTEQGILGTSGGIKLRDITDALTDYRIWMYLLIEFCVQFTAATAANWAPVLLQDVKWTLTQSTALAFIPQVLTIATVLSTGLLMRKVKKIYYCLLFSTVGTLIAFVINFMGKHSRAAHTAAIMIFPIFVIPSCVFVAAWMNLNITGPTKSAVANAMLTCAASLAAFANSYAYLDAEKPWYPNGHASNIGLQGAVIVFTVILALLLRFTNKKRDENPKDISGLSEEELKLLGHKHPDFRYSL
ncbi:transporter [Dipsacomyces acuminosporus]|nr:transporter [Dipsacomyces acuminosporus]